MRNNFIEITNSNIPKGSWKLTNPKNKRMVLEDALKSGKMFGYIPEEEIVAIKVEKGFVNIFKGLITKFDPDIKFVRHPLIDEIFFFKTKERIAFSKFERPFIFNYDIKIKVTLTEGGVIPMLKKITTGNALKIQRFFEDKIKEVSYIPNSFLVKDDAKKPRFKNNIDIEAVRYLKKHYNKTFIKSIQLEEKVFKQVVRDRKEIEAIKKNYWWRWFRSRRRYERSFWQK